MPIPRGAATSRAGWLTLLSVGAVIAVNVAGLWSIAVAWRSVVDEAGRLFRLETEARARTIEGAIARGRLDLVFLTGSSAIARLDTGQGSSLRARDSEWRRLGAEAALLIFLRGHPEIVHISVMVGKADPVVQAGWRGGVPMVWLPPEGTRAAIETPDVGAKPRIFGVFALDTHAATPSALRLVAELDPRAVMAPIVSGAEGARQCQLTDAAGRPLTSETHETSAGPRGSDSLSAEASVRAAGWSSPSPWRLTCVQNRAATVALLEPLSRRYRLTLGLNLGVMAVTLLLGFVTIHQLRRRERLEGQAREEARVRELERQLFHAERLATVGRVVAGIAHEINNPLEGMLNYLTLAEDDLARGDAAAASRRMGGVREGLGRVAGIVEQVLVQADPATAPPSPVELGGLIRQTVAFVESRRAFREIAFTVSLPDEPLLAPGRSVMLGQVFMNLVLNACEAQPNGGEVRVSAARKDGRIQVAIADRGAGIALDDLARIFEPFFSTKEGSTGLGLSVCHTIVGQHGGELTAQNREGGGATFTVSLPAWVEAEHA
jgi:signal transduction histidine kinase